MNRSSIAKRSSGNFISQGKSRFFQIIPMVFMCFLLAPCTDKGSTDYVREGIANTNLQEYEKAMRSFKRAIRMDEKNPEAHFGLGGIYNYFNMHEEAARSFETTLRLDPTHYNAHYSLGFTYEKLGRKEPAEKEYQRFRELKKKWESVVKKTKKTS